MIIRYFSIHGQASHHNKAEVRSFRISSISENYFLRCIQLFGLGISDGKNVHHAKNREIDTIGQVDSSTVTCEI